MEKKLEELNGFKNLRIVDNFYQTSSFFPMPTTEIGTLSESGQTNLGSYSLCFSILYCRKGLLRNASLLQKQLKYC